MNISRGKFLCTKLILKGRGRSTFLSFFFFFEIVDCFSKVLMVQNIESPSRSA